MYPENETITKNDSIRREWSSETREWQFSIVDVIALTTQSSDPRNYWKVLKNRLKKAQNKLVTECNQLKMLASDGKYYLTDTANMQIIQDIVRLVSPESVLPLRLWMESLEAPKPSYLNAQGWREKLAGYTYPQAGYVEEEISVKIAIPEDEELEVKIDGFRENNLLIIRAFVAGIEVENLLVSATPRTLTIKGERKQKLRGENYQRNYNAEELAWGNFSRVIELPEEIEIDQVEVTEYHGLLTVRMPITNKSQSKLLKVKTIIS